MRFAATILLLCTPSYASEAQCATDGTDYYYAESVDGSTRSISNNNCVNYAVKRADKIENTYNIPQNPMYDPSVELSLSMLGNTIGIIQSGAQVFSAYLGDQIDAVDYSTSATAVEGDAFDPCDGHMNAAGTYHVHMPPSCLLRQKGMAAGAHSPQIGWAADGFPIYGPLGPGGTVMKTCTVTGGTEGTDICTDDCTGYYGDIGDGYMYRYYMLGEWNDGTCCVFPKTFTEDNDAQYFPFSPYCLRGCCPSGATCDMMPNRDLPSCSDSAEAGVVSSFDTSYTLPALELNADSCADGSDMCNTAARDCGDTCEYSTTVFGPAPPPTPPSPPPAPKPPPAPPCLAWCEGNTNENKCTWNNCAGCAICMPSPPPAPPPAPPCLDWCEGSTDENKCTWNNCAGCTICMPSPPPAPPSPDPPPSPPPAPSPPPCLAWCEGNTNANKCNWNNCAGCDFCAETEASTSSKAEAFTSYEAGLTKASLPKTATVLLSLDEQQTERPSSPSGSSSAAVVLGLVFVAVGSAVVVVRHRRRSPQSNAEIREAGEKLPLRV